MAMFSSVTVSMGEDRRGVLREMRLVTGESRVASEAAKPARICQTALQSPGLDIVPTYPGSTRKSL